MAGSSRPDTPVAFTRDVAGGIAVAGVVAFHVAYECEAAVAVIAVVALIIYLALFRRRTPST